MKLFHCLCFWGNKRQKVTIVKVTGVTGVSLKCDNLLQEDVQLF